MKGPEDSPYEVSARIADDLLLLSSSKFCSRRDGLQYPVRVALVLLCSDCSWQLCLRANGGAALYTYWRTICGPYYRMSDV